MQWTDTLLAYSVLICLIGCKVLLSSRCTPGVKYQFSNLLHNEFCARLEVACLSLHPKPFFHHL